MQCSFAAAPYRRVASDPHPINPYLQQVLKNAPNIDIVHAANIVKHTIRLSAKHKVPADAVLALMMVESSYRLNIVAGADYGILQVNAYNIRALKLDKKRLLTDLAYSIESGIRVFAWFYRTYGLKEGIIRYNVGTAPGADQWKTGKRYFNKVVKYL